MGFPSTMAMTSRGAEIRFWVVVGRPQPVRRTRRNRSRSRQANRLAVIRRLTIGDTAGCQPALPTIGDTAGCRVPLRRFRECKLIENAMVGVYLRVTRRRK